MSWHNVISWLGKDITQNRYQPTDSSGKFFYHYIKECIYCKITIPLVNHTALGFCYDSLNWLNIEMLVDFKNFVWDCIEDNFLIKDGRILRLFCILYQQIIDAG